MMIFGRFYEVFDMTVSPEQMARNVEKLTNPGTGSQAQTLHPGDAHSIGAAKQAEAERYLQDYNKMLAEGKIPSVHIGETVTASTGDESVAAHYNKQGKIDKISEHDALGYDRTYTLDENGKVTGSTQEKTSYATGYKFDDGPMFTVQTDPTRIEPRR
jgi:hypothetical protein